MIAIYLGTIIPLPHTPSCHIEFRYVGLGLVYTDKTLSHNVVSSTPRLSGILTHNGSGDRY